MEMLRAPWNLQEGYHILFVSVNPCASVSYELSLSTAIELSIRWSFIRWGLSVEALIRWSLAVEALSVEAYIRWCIHPLMHTSVDGCYPLKLCRDIRWCFILIRWCLQFISWHYFTYIKLQGMIYLQLAFLFAYPLVVNMTHD